MRIAAPAPPQFHASRSPTIFEKFLKYLSHVGQLNERSPKQAVCNGRRRRKAMQADENDEELEAKRHQLTTWIEANVGELTYALRPFARQLFYEKGKVPEETLAELLSETTRRALEHAADYDTTRLPHLWLLGIARNITLEWRDREIKWRHREKNALLTGESSDFPNRDIYERLLFHSSPDFSGAVLDAVWVTQLLASAPAAYREVMEAFIASDYDTEATARHLQITPVNVRQRLTRARNWFKEHVSQYEPPLSSGGRR